MFDWINLTPTPYSTPTYTTYSKESNFNFRYVRLGDLDVPLETKMAELFANSVDPDQMLHSAASDLGLHCLPITL